MTFPYPGIPTTADGAEHVVYVDTNITEAGCAYPITSSTTMGGGYQAAFSNGKKNLWDTQIEFIELESEHSSASTCEGFALAGGRVSNFTSGQGLILMKEVLYTIAGKRLPVVFHIGARALTSQSLNVHAGHDDVMGVADCGWGIVFGRDAQETGDLALIARRTAEDTYTPFLNVQDGFLTTHTVENVLLSEPEFMAEYIGDPVEKLKNLMDPKVGLMSGVIQNQDSYMKGKIAQRYYYDRIPAILAKNMDLFYEKTGRRYLPVDPYRMDDAEYAIVGMGSYMLTAKATVDHMRAAGRKVGCVHVTSFRPFPSRELVECLHHVKAISVLERMDEPLAQSNPLTRELKAAFADAVAGHPGMPAIDRIPVIYSGSAGLGSRDVRPGHFVAMLDNMSNNGTGKRYFVVGIDHEHAITSDIDPDVRPGGAFSMRGHSVGGYGSVTTNKIIATIAQDLFGTYVQAYPKYGSEKKGLPTTYFLTVANEKILAHCELNQVAFVPVNDVNAFQHSNPVVGIEDGGMVFVQTDETDPQRVWDDIPAVRQKFFVEKKLRLLYLDTVAIAREVSTSADLIQRMQGIVLLGIFLKVTPFAEQKNLAFEQLMTSVEKSLRKYFGRRGEQVVRDNLTCVKRGYAEVAEVPASIIHGQSTGAESTLQEIS